MKRYLKACLLSPLWFPFVALFVGVICNDLGDNIISTLGFYLFFSLIYGGIQYLIAMVIVWRQIDFDQVATWIVWVLLLPLIFTLIQLITMIPFFIESSGFEWLVYFGIFDLVFGYGYVMIWLLGCGLIACGRVLCVRDSLRNRPADSGST